MGAAAGLQVVNAAALPPARAVRLADELAVTPFTMLLTMIREPRGA